MCIHRLFLQAGRFPAIAAVVISLSGPLWAQAPAQPSAPAQAPTSAQSSAQAPTSANEIRDLRAEMRQLRQEVEAIKAARGKDPTGPGTSRRLSLQEQIEILTEELERMKLGRATGKKFESVRGMGPSASEVYHSESGLTWGGYGEVKYRNYLSPYLTDQVDVHRFILYAGYRFNDWILLNAEIEYEHAGFRQKEVLFSADGTTDTVANQNVNSGEVFVEFAYVDFEFAPWFQLSLGLNLMPVGIVNYLHEPTTFYSTERPLTETNIIPTTWREIGAIFHGEFLNGTVAYRLGVVNGGRAANMTESTWIRRSRTKGSLAGADDFAGVFNLEFKPIEGLTIGGSYYGGNHGQGEIPRVDFISRFSVVDDSANDTESLDDPVNYYLYTSELETRRRANVRVNLAESHLDYQGRFFSVRGLVARGWMSEEDTRAVNAATGQNIGKVVHGGYAEAGVNVLAFVKGTDQRLVAFARTEYVNTQVHTVERHDGGKFDLLDEICADITGCRTTSELPNGNRDLGIIEQTGDDPDNFKEPYSVGTPNPVNDRRIITYGLAYYPHPNVTLKLDYESHDSSSRFLSDLERFNPNNNKVDRVNFSLGFIF